MTMDDDKERKIPKRELRILELSSPDVDPRRQRHYLTILDGTSAVTKSWKRVPYEPQGVSDETSDKISSTSLKNFLFENVLKHFLPAQYPNSVATGYSSYAAYSFGASIAGSAAMVLSTQTLLLAVGVVGSGSGQASVLAGALNWVLKDGVGQLGGVLYASVLGRTRRFDANPKRWRMVAALCLDLGTLLEILSPYATKSSDLVLPLACVANVLKNIGFLTASASRASLHQAMAIKGNLGDVTAKSGSQSTAAGLGGTSLGIGISTSLSSSASVETYVVAFCVLSMLHQVGNYLSVRSVPLNHFNNQRLHILLEDYCSKIDVPKASSLSDVKVLSPQDVASREAFLPWISSHEGLSSSQWLILGARLSSMAPNGEAELRALFEVLADERYLVNTDEENYVFVTFCSNATGEDMLQGMLHAYLLKHFKNDWKNEEAVSKSLDLVKQQMPNLVKQMQINGWRLGSESFIIEPREAIRYKID